MVAPTPIGFNFSNIGNYNLTFNIPTTSTELIPTITATANSVTNNVYGYVILSAVWFILFWLLKDNSPFANFRYSSGRAVAIAFGIVGVMGLSLLEAGFITSFRSVAIMIILYVLSFIFVLSYENKE